MKNTTSELIRDKLFLVVLVLGLLTIVAAAGVMTMKQGSGDPYMNMEEGGNLLAQERTDIRTETIAGASNGQPADNTKDSSVPGNAAENPDTAVAEGQKITTAMEKTSEASSVDQAEVKEVDSGFQAASAFMLNFVDNSQMIWPVRGNVLLDYSMESTIYFPTLDLYKCNPGLVIQGEVSDPVYAPANARILEVGTNEEIGSYVKMDLGNEYTAVCGQLKDVTAVKGEYLEKGQLIGYLAEPTKYYSIEGSNLFFEVKHGEEPVDPLNYLE